MLVGTTEMKSAVVTAVLALAALDYFSTTPNGYDGTRCHGTCNGQPRNESVFLAKDGHGEHVHGCSAISRRSSRDSAAGSETLIGGTGNELAATSATPSLPTISQASGNGRKETAAAADLTVSSSLAKEHAHRGRRPGPSTKNHHAEVADTTALSIQAWAKDGRRDTWRFVALRNLAKLFWRLTILVTIRRLMARGRSTLSFLVLAFRRLLLFLVLIAVLGFAASSFSTAIGDEATATADGVFPFAPTASFAANTLWSLLRAPVAWFLGGSGTALLGNIGSTSAGLLARVLVSRSVLRLAGLAGEDDVRDDASSLATVHGSWRGRMYDFAVVLACRYVASWRGMPSLFARAVDASLFAAVTLIDVTLLVLVGRRFRPALLRWQTVGM